MTEEREDYVRSLADIVAKGTIGYCDKWLAKRMQAIEDAKPKPTPRQQCRLIGFEEIAERMQAEYMERFRGTKGVT